MPFCGSLHLLGVHSLAPCALSSPSAAHFCPKTWSCAAEAGNDISAAICHKMCAKSLEKMREHVPVRLPEASLSSYRSWFRLTACEISKSASPFGCKSVATLAGSSAFDAASQMRIRDCRLPEMEQKFTEISVCFRVDPLHRKMRCASLLQGRHLEQLNQRGHLRHLRHLRHLKHLKHC